MSELNWSYQTTRKLAKYHEEQIKAQRYVYLVSVHNILLELVMKTDQTGIHLVPSSGCRTWEIKDAKKISYIDKMKNDRLL